MEDPLTRFFIYVIILSLIIYFISGIILIASKKLAGKKRIIISSLLLVMGLLNLLMFNLFIFKKFEYRIGELISLIVFFIIPFIEGWILLSTKDVKKKLRTTFGILLILLPIFWVFMGLLGI